MSNYFSIATHVETGRFVILARIASCEDGKLSYMKIPESDKFLTVSEGQQGHNPKNAFDKNWRVYPESYYRIREVSRISTQLCHYFYVTNDGELVQKTKKEVVEELTRRMYRELQQ